MSTPNKEKANWRGILKIVTVASGLITWLTILNDAPIGVQLTLCFVSVTTGFGAICLGEEF